MSEILKVTLNKLNEIIEQQAERIKELEAENKRWKETNQNLNRRTQEAESALVEWQKFSDLTKKQSTGRFFPAMMRWSLTKAAERIKELEAENKKLKALKCPPIESGDTCICLIEELEAEIEELEAENDKFKDALVRIDNWAKAYPLVAFPKPDLKKAAMVLKAAGMTLDAISADAMRHVLDGVKDITGKALKGN